MIFLKNFSLGLIISSLILSSAEASDNNSNIERDQAAVGHSRSWRGFLRDLPKFDPDAYRLMHGLEGQSDQEIAESINNSIHGDGKGLFWVSHSFGDTCVGEHKIVFDWKKMLQANPWIELEILRNDRSLWEIPVEDYKERLAYRAQLEMIDLLEIDDRSMQYTNWDFSKIDSPEIGWVLRPFVLPGIWRLDAASVRSRIATIQGLTEELIDTRELRRESSASVISYALALIDKIYRNVVSQDVILALGKIHESERGSIIYQVKRLAQAREWSYEAYAYAVSVLGEIKEMERESVISSVDELAEGKEWSGKVFVRVILALGKIHESERESIISQVKGFAEEKEWSGEDCAYVISALGEIQEAERGFILSHVKGLAEGAQWSGKDYARVISAYGEIQEAERGFIISHVKELTKGKRLYGGKSYARVISALGEIQESERGSIISHVQGFARGKLFGGKDYACVISALGEVQESERGFIISHVKELTKGKRLYSEGYAYVISALGGIQQSKRESIISHAKGLAEGAQWLGKGYARVISALGEIQESERESIISHAKELSEGKEWPFKDCFRVITALCEVKEKERKSIISLVEGLAEGKKWPSKRYAHVISALGEVEEKERKSITSHVKGLAKGYEVSNKSHADVILALAKVEEKERGSIISHVKELDEGTDCILARCLHIISALCDIPENERDSIISHVKGLPEGEEWHRKHYAYVISALGKIPQSGRKAIISHVIRLAEGKLVPHSWFVIVMSALGKIQESERGSMISHLMRIAEEGELSCYDYANVISALGKIQESERGSIIFHAKGLAEGKQWLGKDYANVISALGKIPQSGRKSIISHVIRLAEGRLVSHRWFVIVISALGEIQEAERGSIISHVQGFVKGKPFYGKDYAYVIYALGKIKEKERESILSHVAKFATGKKLSGEDCAYVIGALGEIEKRKRESTIYRLAELAKGKQWSGHDCQIAIRAIDQIDYKYVDVLSRNLEKNLTQALAAMLFIPTHQLETYVNGLLLASKHKEAFFKHYDSYGKILLKHVAILGTASPEEKNKLFTHWNEFLKVQRNELTAALLVEFIINYSEELALPEEHELMQMALRVACVLQGNDNQDNPYAVYQKLLEKRQEVVDWNAIGNKVFAVDKVPYRVIFEPKSLPRFLESVDFDFDAVPDVTWEKFEELVSHLSTILEQGNNDANSNAGDANSNAGDANTNHSAYDEDFPEQLGCIASGTGVDLPTILRNALKEGSFYRLMIQMPKGSIAAGKLKCVIQSFINRGDSQEKWREFATFLTSVRNCRTGQKDTVHTYYMHLSLMHRALKIGKVDKTHAPALSVLTDLLQKFAFKQLANENDLMRDICMVPAGEEIEQASHQIQYLNGAIGDKIGLSEKPSFDLHADVIYTPILDSSAQDLLKKYYEHFDPRQLIKFLQVNISKALLLDSGKMNNELYQSLCQMWSGKVANCFQMNEDYSITGITEFGVISLLQHQDVGICKKSDTLL